MKMLAVCLALAGATISNAAQAQTSVDMARKRKAMPTTNRLIA